MSVFDDKMQQDMANIVTFMIEWAGWQSAWIEQDYGSTAGRIAADQKQFYAARAYRSCNRLGIDAVRVIGSPAVQDAIEYERQIMDMAKAPGRRAATS